MSSYLTLVNDVLNKVDEVLEDFVFQGYQGLVDYLKEPLAAAIVLFFVCYGVSISQGWIKGSVSGMTRAIFKVGIIYFLGMNWGHFSEYVYNIFYQGSSEIGAALLTASPLQFTSNGEVGINVGLQVALTEIWGIAKVIFSHGGISNPGPWMSGILLGAIGCLLVMLALLEIVIAKCMLSILFVTAPLFIGFTLFNPTQAFFDRWLGACVSYACLMIFVCAGLGIVVTLDQWILADMVGISADEISLEEVGTAILVTWVCIGIIKRIAVLAMSMGGTVTTISMDENLGGSVGSMLSWAKDGKTSSRHDQDSKLRNASDHRNKQGGSSMIKHVMRKMRSGDEDYDESRKGK